MYMMKLNPEQVSDMYEIRENLRENGIRKPITWQVREAIADYISKNKNEKIPLTGTQKDFKNHYNFQLQK
jgi:hypothetical protein